jgi:hypothetical protein
MFYIGQEVVCINAKPIEVGKICPPLIEGDVYTIEDVAGDMVDVGIKGPYLMNQPWYVGAERFVPIEAFRIEELLAEPIKELQTA